MLLVVICWFLSLLSEGCCVLPLPHQAWTQGIQDSNYYRDLYFRMERKMVESLVDYINLDNNRKCNQCPIIWTKSQNHRKYRNSALLQCWFAKRRRDFEDDRLTFKIVRNWVWFFKQAKFEVYRCAIWPNFLILPHSSLWE